MTITSEQFLVDKNGQRVSVLLDILEYQKILDAIEELESIRIYDDAIASGDESIPFEDAIAEIEKKRL